MRRIRPLTAILGSLLLLFSPGAVVAAGGGGPAPTETFVPGTGPFYQGGAWRGGSLTSPSVWFP